MAQYPSPSPTDKGDGNLQGFTANLAPQSPDKPGGSQVVDGQSLIDAHAPGKMNENRFTSLKPSPQAK